MNDQNLNILTTNFSSLSDGGSILQFNGSELSYGSVPIDRVEGLEEKLTDVQKKITKNVDELHCKIIEEKVKLEKRCDDLVNEQWHNVVQTTKYILKKEEVLREEYEKKLNYVWVALLILSFTILFVSYMMNRLFLNIL